MGPWNASTFDAIAGTCLKRIHSIVLLDCLGHQLVLPIQLLAVHTSMVQVIKDPQTDKTLRHHLTRVVNIQGTIL
jgi:predicted aminopeptidase